MGRVLSRVVTAVVVAWKRLADISTAAWLWSLLPSGAASVIAGLLAYVEGLPKSVVLLVALGVLALVMIVLAGWRVWRAAESAPAAPPTVADQQQPTEFHAALDRYTDPHWSVQDELDIESRRREEQEHGFSEGFKWRVVAGDPREIERDVSLSEALTYHVEGGWGCRYFDSVKAGRNPDGEPLARAIQLAYDGKLTIWGKRSEAGVYEIIPKDFWSSHHIDNFSLWREHAVTVANSKTSEGPLYSDLMVSRAEFEEALPYVRP